MDVSEQLVRAVCRRFAVSRDDILGGSLAKTVTRARQRLMLELWVEGWSQSRIGRFLGRTPATVGGGVRGCIVRLLHEDDRAIAQRSVGRHRPKVEG